jgi:uncharacterized protein (TIGR02118 family)
MLKSVAFFKRRPDLGLEAFQRYWRERHGPLVARLPGLRRYVQSHTRPSGYRRGEPAYDGIAELWTDDVAALRALAASPEYAAVRADEANFIDPASMMVLRTVEHVVKDGPPPPGGVKSVEFVRRRPDLAVADFQRYWREVHGPLAARIPVLRRYVQSHVTPESYGRREPPPYDGIALTWFDSTDAMRVSAGTAEYRATRADEPNFIAPGPLPFIITTEHVVM